MMLFRSTKRSEFGTMSKGSQKYALDPSLRKPGKERKVMVDLSDATDPTVPSLDDSSRNLRGESDLEAATGGSHFDNCAVVDVDEIIAMRHHRLEDVTDDAQSTTVRSTALLERQEETSDYSDNNFPRSDLWLKAEAEGVTLEGSDRRSQLMRTDGFRVDRSRMDAMVHPPKQQLAAMSLLKPRSPLPHTGKKGRRDRNQDITECGHLSRDEYNLIQDILLHSFDLCPMALHDLVLAFERTEATMHEIIISQGDACDDGSYVYIVAEGECVVDVDGIVVPGPYGTYKPKSIFGVGVLYNATRAATISAKTDRVVLYRACASAFTTAFQLQPDDEDKREDEELLNQIDAAINQVSGTKSLYGGDIIRQYQPGRLWLWSQWRGTILEHNIKTTLAAMLLAAAITVLARLAVDPTWPIGGIPDDTHPVIQHLSQLQKCWQMVMPLVTFVLTFYVNQAYLVWQKTTVTTRQIQGRISDFSLVLAASCKRNPDGTYTEEAERLMDDVAASSRLFHALFWSKQARRFHCLSTSTGLARMAQRGMITPKQLQVLQSLSTPSSTYYSACLEWMMIRAHQGVEDNLVYSPSSVSLQLLELMCQLRSATAKLTDNLKSRMPLAYTHFVQVLVDTFVWSSPFVLYADLGMYSILSVGIIALFYTGLMDLAKLFLDPLNNQCLSSKAINMGMDLGVLTRESNDSSNHYKESGANIPFSSNKELNLNRL